jgi:hypothetical protein
MAPSTLVTTIGLPITSLRKESILIVFEGYGRGALWIVVTTEVIRALMGLRGLRMSAFWRILLFDIIPNRLKPHFKLMLEELKITFDFFRFAVLHVRQVQLRGLSIEVRKCAIQRVKYPCEITLLLRAKGDGVRTGGELWQIGRAVHIRAPV